LRMALQTREQHIKRDKATSNICTAQALLAVMASMYAVYHGPKGMREIAEHVHGLATTAAQGLSQLGVQVTTSNLFDTILVKGVQSSAIQSIAEEHQMNFHYLNDHDLTISFGEPHTLSDVQEIIEIFAKVLGKTAPTMELVKNSCLSADQLRLDAVFTHPTFNSYHSESKMMRYLKRLENKDLSLVHSMIPLGSCTMKLNATTEMIPVSWPEFGSLHPFIPRDQAKGYTRIFEELEHQLKEVTGFDGISLQPNAGAQGDMPEIEVPEDMQFDTNGRKMEARS